LRQIGEHALSEEDAKEFASIMDMPSVTLFNAQVP
jgi:hypothetical protein